MDRLEHNLTLEQSKHFEPCSLSAPVVNRTPRVFGVFGVHVFTELWHSVVALRADVITLNDFPRSGAWAGLGGMARSDM